MKKVKDKFVGSTTMGSNACHSSNACKGSNACPAGEITPAH